MRRALSLLSVAALCGGCWKVTVPIGQRRYALDAARPQRCLLVLLPGFGDAARRFEKEGFVAALRRARVAADIVALEAHFGYYRSGVLMTRLEHDVLRPARARGYRRVWLLGISMGGAGAFGAAGTYPDRVAGAMLVAPYLGDGELLDEIARAGGPRRWHPGADFDGERFVGPRRARGRAAHFRALWSWARRQRRSDGTRVAIYLAAGRDDGALRSARLLARALPPGRLFVRPGGHDWDVWLPLFRDLLAAGFLQRDCGVSGVRGAARSAGRRRLRYAGR